MAKIRVGKVGRAHGVNGALRIFMDDEGSDSLLDQELVYLASMPGGEGQPYKLLNAHRAGRFVAITLEGLVDRDIAAHLTGYIVYIERSSLKNFRDAFYSCDLLGLSIVDENGKVWGAVQAVLPNGPQELLRYVRRDGSLGYVPFVKAHVGDVDLEARQISVDSEWMAQLDAVYEA